MSQSPAANALHDEPPIEAEALQPGVRLLRGQYEILGYLSNGGFGITYLARDSLDRDVVIKECYPQVLCKRVGDKVAVADPAYKDDLDAIVELFIQEARNHARLVHPNIVNVHQVFEDNDTAYISMDLIRGCDLLDYVEDRRTETGPEFFIRVTEKMLSAVSFIHQNGMLHRDISPDNILIDEHGEPILIDFGAAREQAANKSAALLTLRVIKDGYSPHEFYVRGADQGPSSDLYVLAATLYHAICGERPIDGQTRLSAFNNGQDDPYEPLVGRFAGYPQGFLEAIDKALELHTTDRVASALEWLRMFRGPKVRFDTFDYRPVSVIVGLERGDENIAQGEGVEGLELGEFDGDEENGEAPVAIDTVIHRGESSGNRLLTSLAVMAIFAAGGYYAFPYVQDAYFQPVIAENTVETEETTTPVADTSITTVETSVAVEEPIVSETLEPAAETGTTTSSDEITVEPVQPVATIEVATLVEPTVEPTVEITPAEPQEPATSVTEETTPAVTLIPVELAENQIAFAHWDVEVPFSVSRRRASTGSTFTVTDVNPAQDLSVIGNWVQRGSTIYTLNGVPVREGMPLAAQVLEHLEVDPDGFTRVAVRYRPLGETRAQNGLLALPAHRVVGLENGYVFEIHGDGENGWHTEVSDIPAERVSDLRVGDVLLEETETGTAITDQQSLDQALAALVSENKPLARFLISRNGLEANSIMRLTQEE